MLRLLVTNVTQGNVIILLNKIDKKLIQVLKIKSL
jgi:hypothetical protein